MYCQHRLFEFKKIAPLSEYDSGIFVLNRFLTIDTGMLLRARAADPGEWLSRKRGSSSGDGAGKVINKAVPASIMTSLSSVTLVHFTLPLEIHFLK